MRTKEESVEQKKTTKRSFKKNDMETGRCEYKQQKKLSPILGNSFNTILHLHAMLRFQIFSSIFSEKNSFSFFLKAELPIAYDEGLGMSVLQIKKRFIRSYLLLGKAEEPMSFLPLPV